MATVDRSAVEEPATAAERAARCRHCLDALGLTPIPTVVDGLDDRANLAYEAWPDRLLLLDREGRVAWRSPPGPYGFDLEELATAITEELRRQRGERVEG